MSNHSETPRTARCFRETCHRRGKVTHACAICELKLRACNFHRDVCFSALQQHVIAEHPAEYRAARDAEMHARARASGELVTNHGTERIEPRFVTPMMSVGKGR